MSFSSFMNCGTACATSVVYLFLLSGLLTVQAQPLTQGHPFDSDGEAEPWWPSEHQLSERFHIEADAATWSYNPIDTVNAGPLQWSTFAPTCAGQSQSPIDIATNSAVYMASLAPLTLSSSTLGTNMIVNNGHAIQVNGNASDTVVLLSGGNLPKGQTYSFTQFHFHTNSEHTINGGLGAAELHFVFSNPNVTYPDPRQLAVVGVIFKAVDTDNPALNPIVNLLKQGLLQNEGNASMVAGLSLGQFIKTNALYYTYSGSLTTPAASGATPGCAETVTWHVLADMQPASVAQIAYLHNAMYANQQPYMLTNRPVQPLFGRTVLTNVVPPKATSSSASSSHGNFIGSIIASLTAAVLSIFSYH